MLQHQSLVSAEAPGNGDSEGSDLFGLGHALKITSIADAGSPLHRGLLCPQLLDVHVGDDENDEEPQRVEDEEDAPTRVADGEVRDAGRAQGAAESEIAELSYLG